MEDSRFHNSLMEKEMDKMLVNVDTESMQSSPIATDDEEEFLNSPPLTPKSLEGRAPVDCLSNRMQTLGLTTPAGSVGKSGIKLPHLRISDFCYKPQSCGIVDELPKEKINQEVQKPSQSFKSFNSKLLPTMSNPLLAKNSEKKSSTLNKFQGNINSIQRQNFRKKYREWEHLKRERYPVPTCPTPSSEEPPRPKYYRANLRGGSNHGLPRWQTPRYFRSPRPSFYFQESRVKTMYYQARKSYEGFYNPPFRAQRPGPPGPPIFGETRSQKYTGPPRVPCPRCFGCGFVLDDSISFPKKF